MIAILAKMLVIVFGVAGVAIVAVGLPGTWLIVASAALYSLFYRFDGGATSPYWVNGILIGLAVFGEIVEFVVGTFGSKTLKVSNGAIWCALFGGIVGAIVGVPVFLIGAMLGMFLGAFLGALIYEWLTLKSFGRALKSAMAVLATKMVATSLKVALGAGMMLYLGFKLF